ncbi:YbcC family protein [Paludibacterium sp. THUN1379]|uniref:YbcC family protein n=1 Tax=Paludibacterium sp. THUN1379 TaxID=3112107 RepID=UPI00308E5FE3|nr:YbcC family protein [Paludibacterium sp. THUN1379]
MNARSDAAVSQQTTLCAAVERACGGIAPAWPLDQLIAVNPHWGAIDLPFAEQGARLTRLMGRSLFPSRQRFAEDWRQGRIQPGHLDLALQEGDHSWSRARLIAWLDQPEPPAQRWPLLVHVLDARRDLGHAPAWSTVLTQQISQFCAAWFDDGQADWHAPHEGSLYQAWLHGVQHDHAVSLLLNAPWLAARARGLPDQAEALLCHALSVLGLPEPLWADYLQALLLSVNGWAAHCAWRDWPERPQAGQLRELLAIRLAWECLLDDGRREAGSVWHDWLQAWQQRPSPRVDQAAALWLRARELAYQLPLARQLAGVRPAAATTPSVQMVFCIDVRSEVLRRHLEQQDSRIETRGFAGFFGLPIAFEPLGMALRQPQLPGLLSPTMTAVESSGQSGLDQRLTTLRQRRLLRRQAAQPFARMPASSFLQVEALGLGYVGKLLRRSLPGRALTAVVAGLRGAEAARLRPRVQIEGDAALDLAERVLTGMGLQGALAPLVLLVGHASQSANNPMAAALDCGACCGQSGEVNARALAELLNRPSVRAGLAQRGWPLGETLFLAALHQTSTDVLQLFDTAGLPAAQQAAVNRLLPVLQRASEGARAERAGRLDLVPQSGQGAGLLAALQVRACDWAQTRPEWGLAGNAAFVAAPRRRTQGRPLDGRVFLHDYDWRQDPDGCLLTQIMTAPVVVAHWINLQYYASTVDNERFGSGNKLLHNVVGGHLGVFEGNAGDLRIGLPLQSLHDGRDWVHEPLRLSVLVEAPVAMLDQVLAAQDLVRQLVQNQWLFLLQIDPQSGAVALWRRDGWQVVAGDGA